MILFSNKYNLISTISRHKDEVLKEDDTKTNDWLLEMNDKGEYSSSDTDTTRNR